MQFTLPDMMRRNPRNFWNLLKQGRKELDGLQIKQFAEYNQNIFYDDTIRQDIYKAVDQPELTLITTTELSQTLVHNYKATKSRGASLLPPQLLKFLGNKGIDSLANFLNESAILSAPPESWRTAKIIPIYKGKGDASLPANYRSIAITPPLSKVFMSVMNNRLTELATSRNLHAPIQAGFRKHHSAMEHILILQTILAHSIKCRKQLGVAFIDLERAYDSISREQLW